jgi:peptide/nickel transport system permease protein
VLVLLAVSLMTFLLVAAAPGDVATAIVARHTGGDAPAALVAQERQRLGLDKPLAERYWTDLGHAIHGDLGVSARTGQPVIHDLATRLPVTLELAGAASLLTVVLGIGAGVLTVLVRSRAFHAALRVLALLGYPSRRSHWLTCSCWCSRCSCTGFLPRAGTGTGRLSCPRSCSPLRSPPR